MNKRIIIISLLIAFIMLIPIIITYVNSNLLYQSTEVEFLIGVSQSNLGEPWHAQLNEDLKKYAKEYDNIRLIFTDASQSSKKQVRDINKLMKYGIDLLIISPNESALITQKISEIYKNIPVIVLDRNLNREYYKLFISGDNYKIGLKAGEDILKLLGEDGGNVVEITGLKGSVSSFQRSKGFRDEICNYTNINISQIQCTWIRDDAKDLFKEFLINTKQPVDIVFAHNDEMAFGAYKAAKELKYNGITFFGIDGLEGVNMGIDLVSKGILEKTYIYPNGAEEAIVYAIKILNGENISKKRVELDVVRVE